MFKTAGIGMVLSLTCSVGQAMCGSEAIAAAENFILHIARSELGQLSIVKESNNDLVFSYVIQNTISNAAVEIYSVEADLDSYCTIQKVEFLGYK